jgi:hypothetical protein
VASRPCVIAPVARAWTSSSEPYYMNRPSHAFYSDAASGGLFAQANAVRARAGYAAHAAHQGGQGGGGTEG